MGSLSHAHARRHHARHSWELLVGSEIMHTLSLFGFCFTVWGRGGGRECGILLFLLLLLLCFSIICTNVCSFQHPTHQRFYLLPCLGHHHHHLSFNHEGQWGTTYGFTTSFLHFPLFSNALWENREKNGGNWGSSDQSHQHWRVHIGELMEGCGGGLLSWGDAHSVGLCDLAYIVISMLANVIISRGHRRWCPAYVASEQASLDSHSCDSAAVWCLFRKVTYKQSDVFCGPLAARAAMWN